MDYGYDILLVRPFPHLLVGADKAVFLLVVNIPSNYVQYYHILNTTSLENLTYSLLI